MAPLPLPQNWNYIPTQRVLLAMGGILMQNGFRDIGLPHMKLNQESGISIEWQERFPIVVACAIWFPHFSGRQIQFWCDNESVVAIIKTGH